jgi:hydroxymethylpyrimidine pyrophosphatase-like HAD family hydrolase
VGVIVVNCGLCRVWEKVLEMEGFSDKVKVIGSGRVLDDLIVTPAAKAAMVARLQNVHQMEVSAFGDSVLDLGMMIKADQSVVIVGDGEARSKTMEMALVTAIDASTLQAWQAIMNTGTPPYLNTIRLPIIELTAPCFTKSIVSRHVGL